MVVKNGEKYYSAVTQTHTYIHTYIHTYMHTYIHTEVWRIIVDKPSIDRRKRVKVVVVFLAEHPRNHFTQDSASG